MTETPTPTPPREPIFNGLPLVVAALCAAIFAIHALDAWLMSRGEQSFHTWLMIVATVRTGALVVDIPPAPLGGATPFVLHVFVHFGWLHLLMNLGILLALGAATMRPFGQGITANIGFLAFFFVCAIGGAVLSSVVHASEPQIMAGASTAISGLLAAAGWARGGRAGMMSLAVPWLVINLAMALADQLVPIPISWSGHIGGLIVGAVTYPVFVSLFGTRR